MNEVAPSVMVVDDEVRMCESLKKLLSAKGYQVETFVDGAKALSALESNHHFDCVITDIKMPGMDGIEVLRGVQKHDPEAPVILMTGYGSLDSAREAIDEGAYGYLLKPVEISDVHQMLQRGLERRRSSENRRELMARLERQNQLLRERLKEIRALHRVGISVSSAQPLPEVLEHLLRGATQVTGAEQGSLMLLNEAGEELSIHAAIGLPDEVVQTTRLKVGEGISGLVAQTGDVVRVDNVADDPRFAKTPHPRYESKSFLSVPLRIADRILGVLNVSSKSGGVPFRARDLRVLTVFAAQAAALIDDAHHFERYRQQLEEQRVLFNIARETATAERFEDVATAIYESLSEVLPLDFGLWLAWNEVRSVLHHRFARGAGVTETDWSDFQMNLPADIWQDEAKFSSQVVHAVKHYPAWQENLNVIQVMPIRSEERPRGALVLGSHRAKTITPQQAQFTTIAGSQAAAVYERQQGALDTTRMTTMGNMISEIAHDLKKPLTNLRGSLQLLNQKHPELADINPFYESAEQEIHHINDLLRELVDFSNPVRYPLDRVLLRTPLDRALTLIKSEAERRGIEVVESHAPHPIHVRGQESEIVKALLNIMHNAIDSMMDGGQLTVRTYIAHPEDQPDNFAAVAVKDTGPGIEDSEKHRIFARHFTTKESGSGLGLAIVERIMQAHNGFVGLDSVPGKGAEFTLYFPLSA